MISKVLFLDIETVPLYYPYSSMPDVLKKLWDEKHAARIEKSPEEHYEKAGIYAEFSRVFCVGYGYSTKEKHYKIGVLKGQESNILTELKKLIQKLSEEHHISLCAHNGKEFDIPFLCRRFLANQIIIPDVMNFQGKKPWEVNIIDTMQLWKFGDYKNFTSLDLLAHVFNIPSPKKNMKGSDVCKKVHEEKAYEDVYAYCKEDVKTLIKIYFHLTERHETANQLTFEETA
ncbi:MAG: ribonuclease H-like domain-containing protein [Bacteroidia bacterium]|nr:ribonuclease H-like domain-containing protein [Bacteroidia bacterium]